MRSTRTIKMKKMSVISVIVNRSFAFVKGNRPTNSKAVTANEVHRGVRAVVADYGCGR